MEPGGGTSGAKRVDVDTNSSELSASTASNTMLPHLEATNAEGALNENERRRRKETRKLKKRSKREEEGGGAVRGEEAKERRKKAQERSKKKKKRS